MSIPRPGASSRDDYEPPAIELVLPQRPVEERNPVQQLETHLADPRPYQERRVGALKPLQLALESFGCGCGWYLIELFLEQCRDDSPSHDRDRPQQLEREQTRAPNGL